MQRTQIYLTPQEHRILSLLSHLEGRKKSEIIRGILDEKLGPGTPRVALAAATQALGAWKGRVSKNYLRRIRSHW